MKKYKDIKEDDRGFKPKFKMGDIIKFYDGFFLLGKCSLITDKNNLKKVNAPLNTPLPDFCYDVWHFATVKEIKDLEFDNYMSSGWEFESSLLEKGKLVGNIPSTMVGYSFY